MQHHKLFESKAKQDATVSKTTQFMPSKTSFRVGEGDQG